MTTTIDWQSVTDYDGDEAYQFAYVEAQPFDLFAYIRHFQVEGDGIDEWTGWIERLDGPSEEEPTTLVCKFKSQDKDNLIAMLERKIVTLRKQKQ